MTTEAATDPSASDEEIEAFYRDNSEIIRLLLSAVNALAYNPAKAGEVFRHDAAHFWAGTRGEQTEGHPNYRARNVPAADAVAPPTSLKSDGGAEKIASQRNGDQSYTPMQSCELRRSCPAFFTRRATQRDAA